MNNLRTRCPGISYPKDFQPKPKDESNAGSQQKYFFEKDREDCFLDLDGFYCIGRFFYSPIRYGFRRHQVMVSIFRINSADSVWRGFFAFVKESLGAAQQLSFFSMTMTPSPIPVPGAVWLLASGLIGAAGLRKQA
jgi:hypothetical protein